MCNRLSPGQPYYAVVDPVHLPCTGMVIVGTTNDGRAICHISSREDEANDHLDFCDECFRTRDSVILSFPELDGCETIETDEGSFEIPKLRYHSFGTRNA